MVQFRQNTPFDKFDLRRMSRVCMKINLDEACRALQIRHGVQILGDHVLLLLTDSSDFMSFESNALF